MPNKMKSLQFHQHDVAARLKNRNRNYASVATAIRNCIDGTCNTCGDACLVKARIATGKTATAAKRLFCTKSTVEPFQGIVIVNGGRFGLGKLADYSIPATKKWIARSLDRINDPALLAAGMVTARCDGYEWVVEAALVVRGACEETIAAAFVDATRKRGSYRIKPMAAFARDDMAVLLRESYVARYVDLKEAIGEIPTKAMRGEFYAWLSSIPLGSRIFRYGCDRHFNRLAKQPRVFKLKPKKPRQYHWLEPFQFGSHPISCRCKVCQVHFGSPS